MKKLDISIEPAEVRLITSADDPYTWQSLPQRQHLFRKHLSKHSIGAYRELCREIGVSFEAVRASTVDPAAKRAQGAGARVCHHLIARTSLTKVKGSLTCRDQFRLRD